MSENNENQQDSQSDVGTPLPPTVPEAVQTLIAALRSDEGYLIGWQANLAMSYVDAGGDWLIAQEASARFIELLTRTTDDNGLPPVNVREYAWYKDNLANYHRTHCDPA